MDLTPPRTHGGADAQGAPRWDFSTCANAAGPCPDALAAVQAADPTRYPDPAATAVRHALAALHGVESRRVLPAASASEFIQRVTAITGRLQPGAVGVPRHAYGDYAAAASAWGRPLRVEGERPPQADAPAATLRWIADPSSPLGRDAAPPADPIEHPTVLDAVYAPLRLSGHSPWTSQALDAVFVLHSPNKALGLTGIRGAYAIAPRCAACDVEACCRALEAAAPSWPLSAQAEAMLLAWAAPGAQAWVARSRATLAGWKADLQRRLAARGFALEPGVTPHFVVRPPRPVDLSRLRAQGVAVRDAASFGLPGCWRVSAQPPGAQDALMHALDVAQGAAP
jgi:histidinol-phosphate aminotransferase